jgi:hypothetical protein
MWTDIGMFVGFAIGVAIKPHVYRGVKALFRALCRSVPTNAS